MREARIGVPNGKHPAEMTEKERILWYRSVNGLRALESDLMSVINVNETIPNEWHDLWKGDDRDTKRISVTLRLDADVVRFFKTMGPGYQTRMNTCLRSFMLARLSKYVMGPEAEPEVENPELFVD